MDDGDEDAIFKAYDEGNTATAGISLEDWFAGHQQVTAAIRAAMEAQGRWEKNQIH